MTFLGSYDHGDVPLRQAIRQSQQRYNSEEIFPNTQHLSGQNPRNLLWKQNSTFCLEPVGDSPWRKSLADSIAFGCIPVLFSKDSDDVAPWFWGDWKDRGRILLDREDVVSGRVDLYELLHNIPDDILQIMQETLRFHGSSFQYSLGEDPGDGIDIALRGLRREADRMVANGICTATVTTG